MMDRLLAGRAQFREILDRNGREDVRFYDPDTLNPAATVRDNLLFGRVNESVADARERVRLVGADIIGEMSLRGGIEHVGLDQQVGPAGRLLSSPQRAAVNLLRCIVKRPDILVIDGALAPFGEARATDAMDLLLQETEGRTLVAVLPNDRRMEDFDVLIRFAGGRAEVRELVAEESRRETAPAAAAAE
jgi:putative ABC transport system ATP-binding protein